MAKRPAAARAKFCGAQFTRFKSTTVQILTQKVLRQASRPGSKPYKLVLDRKRAAGVRARHTDAQHLCCQVLSLLYFPGAKLLYWYNCTAYLVTYSGYLNVLVLTLLALLVQNYVLLF